MTLLEVDDVAVRYGAVQALRGVSLTVEEGEIVTLLGANGAGKTTTLRTVSSLLRPVTGEVRFDGKRVDTLPAHQVVGVGIGHVPEGRRVFPTMTVQENLQMGAYRDRKHVKEDTERMLGMFPVLAERRKQDAGTLSGGEQQMLAIGRALMGRPRLLLLDEPSMGLAPLIVARIFQIIRQINADGTTVLLVEQNAAQALRLATRGYVLANGEIVLEGTAKQLLEDPAVRSAYLGEGA
ncbi:MAG: branched-chain amino acid transport system ATP-binding protein [Frankiaceae bacterium]|jgi:branched-chain amino acid transport system ATP-binding protein|nr:branched-chain amino acid transport system ATP-binding protein [Frankiaceae bacterium]MDQ1671692.1 branched-chain amino acid transport system ATP-binding protein [Frankiaceae bacterium]